MPASQRSLRLTETYRRRLVGLSDRVQAEARRAWPQIEELDGTTWPEGMALKVTRAQVEGVRLTAGYVSAFVASETGRRAPTAGIPARDYAGVSRDGRALTEAFRSPIIGVLTALKNGRAPDDALKLGLNRAVRMVGFEALQTPRDALMNAIEADERIEGFQRSVEGTCAACMALSGTSGPQFEVHPGCECIPTPKVSGVRDRFPLPSGTALFTALSKTEQDKKVGSEAAELIRNGEADLRDFVSHSETDSDQPNWITQKPAQDVAT